MSMMDKVANAANNQNRGRKKRGGIKNFFKGVWSELKKVHWPSKAELAKYTGVVVLTVFVFALIVSLFDWIVSSLINLAMGLV